MTRATRQLIDTASNSCAIRAPIMACERPRCTTPPRSRSRSPVPCAVMGRLRGPGARGGTSWATGELLLEALEELPDQHLADAAQHPLPDPGDDAADLHVSHPLEHGILALRLEIDDPFAFHETAAAATLQQELVVRRCLLVRDGQRAFVAASDRGDPDRQRGFVPVR